MYLFIVCNLKKTNIHWPCKMLLIFKENVYMHENCRESMGLSFKEEQCTVPVLEEFQWMNAKLVLCFVAITWLKKQLTWKNNHSCSVFVQLRAIKRKQWQKIIDFVSQKSSTSSQTEIFGLFFFVFQSQAISSQKWSTLKIRKQKGLGCAKVADAQQQ